MTLRNVQFFIRLQETCQSGEDNTIHVLLRVHITGDGFHDHAQQDHGQATTVLKGKQVRGQVLLIQRPLIRTTTQPLKAGLNMRTGINTQPQGHKTAPYTTTPLKSGLFCKKRARMKLSTSVASSVRVKNGAHREHRTRSKSPTSPINMYIGSNFSVRLCQWFHFERLLRNKDAGGVVHTEFHSFRKMQNMDLSDGGQRIKNLPNAGGSSEISEILSYEMLRRCFAAQLVKVKLHNILSFQVITLNSSDNHKP